MLIIGSMVLSVSSSSGCELPWGCALSGFPGPARYPFCRGRSLSDEEGEELAPAPPLTALSRRFKRLFDILGGLNAIPAPRSVVVLAIAHYVHYHVAAELLAYSHQGPSRQCLIQNSLHLRQRFQLLFVADVNYPA